ncbi:S8 family peptidase [Caenimonas koreensis]|uniref:S8 family peptidase n=1 Tax=Caenimonas koreensis TaxID=367474 RepID=UPI00378360F2
MIPINRSWRLALASAAAVAFLASCGGGESMTASASATPAAAAQRTEATPQAAPQVAAATKTYLVQLADKPVLGYEGGVSGLAATKPARGKKIDPESANVTNYMAYLQSRQDKVMRDAGATKKIYGYGYAFNGFAAELTDAQVEKLSSTKGVVAVTPNEIRQLDTATTPQFLGLAGPEGFWATKSKGENVVIGMVDSGITPGSVSFSDKVDKNGNPAKNGTVVYSKLVGWKGVCQRGEEFTASLCNRKLIGARFYNAGFGGDEGINANWPEEFVSPRDWGGHGTHTASTAGGNANVRVTGDAASFGAVSGIAPRARISAYKVCWSETGLIGQQGASPGCATVDSVAAIDQAVADGVDVINFSISGTQTNFRDPVEIAFMFAADAGIFVAASAGNSGPTTGTVAHPSPWLTTVAAGTHNRQLISTLTLGNSSSIVGISTAAKAVKPKPFVDGEFSSPSGSSTTASKLCFSSHWPGGPGLDPAKVRGKIVLCDRGTSDRVDKSLAVQEAGGVGMVLVNTSANTLNADFHSVPTVHVADTNRAALKAYAATPGATASLTAMTIDLGAAAPFTASFSSRGPTPAADGNMLKPDIIGPGQDILASVAPPGNNGRSFDIYSGTSMSSPHIAGLAALMKQLYPNWSPMAIKSAMMTTASDVLDGPNTNPLVIFRQGAGHVNPSKMTNPGLVFDSNFDDWIGFLCKNSSLGLGYCEYYGFTPVAATDMNTASIAVGAMAGSITVTRRVTNVTNSAAVYTPTVSGMTGITVDVQPASLSIAAGETKTFTVKFTSAGATLNSYVGGQLTWTEGAPPSAGPLAMSIAAHTVRIPMVVKPVALAAPTEVSGSYNVSYGFTGTLTTAVDGLVPAAVVSTDISNGASVDFSVVVPAGKTYVRFALFDGDGLPVGTDIDLEVYRGSTLVGSSGGATSAEVVTLKAPTAATYTVRVIGFSVAGTQNVKMYSWQLGGTDAGNMTAVASPATVGTTGTVTLTPTGLVSGTKYMGAITYGGASNLPSPTIVRIDGMAPS